MKKLYIFALASIGYLGVQAQVNQVETPYHSFPSVEEPKEKQEKVTARSSANDIIYWSEDFSNGLEGQDDNGTWTTGGAQGSLWFQAFPAGSPNGYNPNQLIEGYDYLPNWATGTVTVASETAANGFMMLDADRFNSIREVGMPAGNSDNSLSNGLEASLISPSIDLSENESGHALVQWTQSMRTCCVSSFQVRLDVSVDGGTSWIPYNFNNNATNLNVNPEFMAINIYQALGLSEDLSDVKIKFTWPFVANGSHYYWMIDDIKITSLPENDVQIVDNWYNDHAIEIDNPDGNTLDYVDSFEYEYYHKNQVRPLNFTARVVNAGSATQTGITLHATISGPGGLNETYSSDPIDLEAGADTAFIVIPDVVWYEELPAPTGAYTVSFEVTQDQEDDRPEDNVGPNKTFRVEHDFMANDRNVYTNFYSAFTQNMIWTNRFSFVEPVVVTQIGFAIVNTAQATSTPGELIFLNIRKGAVDEDEGPDNEVEQLYGEEDIEYTILEEDLTTSGTPNWIWVNLPEPVELDPFTVYGPELFTPPSTGDVATMALSNGQERFAGLLFDGSDGTWYSMGEATPMLRFGMQESVAVTELESVQGVTIEQNMPNPFASETSVKLTLENTRDITFEIRDVTGKLISSENLGKLTAGEHVHSINAGNLNSGVYLYTVIVDGKERIARRMMIAR